MFRKVLIANRGEIALRIHRACAELGVQTVAVHSTVDADAMHVRLADESVCIGPAPARDSYLNRAALISAATIAGADAIHPGLGFLAEDAAFAAMVEEHGFTFIGPTPEHIAMMGDKITAKQAMREAGVPLVPGTEKAITENAEAHRLAAEIGFPILIKAAGGGGGKGMQRADTPADLERALTMARREAGANFGNDAVYMERYLVRPRHIEVQILADTFGNAVHLGERDCSLQRRYQKVLEEAPSPAIDAETRAQLGETAADAVRRIGYRGVGTLEFLYTGAEFFFIEMNTRIQVEHPITEMITGIDLVREQIRVAAGEPLGYGQADIRFRGHAMECRVNAEDPRTFVPTPGRVTEYHTPGGPGVRVDSALYSGCLVPPHYDSMVAKLIVHGADRDACRMRLKRALGEYVIGGLGNNLDLHRALVENRDFKEGKYDIHWLERWIDGAT